jgi:hypothetical protein
VKGKTKESIFEKGNKKDGKHYWLTPDPVYDFIEKLTGIKRSQLFDPCPYPRPEGFDGLSCDWGPYNYVNIPFGVTNEKGKKIGATAWFRKAMAEVQKGKVVFFVFPIHGWLVEAMIFCGATVYDLGNVKWLATEDGKPGKGCGKIAMFYMGLK